MKNMRSGTKEIAVQGICLTTISMFVICWAAMISYGTGHPGTPSTKVYQAGEEQLAPLEEVNNFKEGIYRHEGTHHNDGHPVYRIVSQAIDHSAAEDAVSIYLKKDEASELEGIVEQITGADLHMQMELIAGMKPEFRTKWALLSVYNNGRVHSMNRHELERVDSFKAYRITPAKGHEVPSTDLKSEFHHAGFQPHSTSAEAMLKEFDDSPKFQHQFLKEEVARWV